MVAHQTVNLQSRVRIRHLPNLPRTCQFLPGKVSKVDIEMAGLTSGGDREEKIQNKIYKTLLSQGQEPVNNFRIQHKKGPRFHPDP